jgi:hypothetical protein
MESYGSSPRWQEPITGKMNPIHTPISNFLKIHPLYVYNFICSLVPWETPIFSRPI